MVAHHGSELYGSDRQLLESVTGLVARGWRVVVAVPEDGPLCTILRQRGATVQLVSFPVVRRSSLTLRGLFRLACASLRDLRDLRELLRSAGADVVYVNTLIIPVWLLAARLARVPALCHVHEAYERGPRVLRAALVSPLLLADLVIANSRASVAAFAHLLPRTAERTVVVYNGVPGPDSALPATSVRSGPRRVVLVGRLSPNKGSDIALDAVGRLRAQGRDVEIHLVGAVFSGYEWFETELRARAAAPDLAGAVHFDGFQPDPWSALEACDVAIVPSRSEPFGNTAVEAQLANRPVVVARTQGLVEIVEDGRTGVVVDPDSAASLAQGIARVLDDAEGARSMADAGRDSARRRFSLDAYHDAIVGLTEKLATG